MRVLYSSRRQEDGYIGNSELKSNALLDHKRTCRNSKVDDTSQTLILFFPLFSLRSIGISSSPAIIHRLKNDVIADHSSGTTRKSSKINPPQTTNASNTIHPIDTGDFGFVLFLTAVCGLPRFAASCFANFSFAFFWRGV